MDLGGTFRALGGSDAPLSLVPQRFFRVFVEGLCFLWVMDSFRSSRSPARVPRGCCWWQGAAPQQCHCHPAEPPGSVSCCARAGEKRQQWKGGRKAGNKGAVGVGLGQSCDTRRVPSLPPHLPLLFLLLVGCSFYLFAFFLYLFFFSSFFPSFFSFPFSFVSLSLFPFSFPFPFPFSYLSLFLFLIFLFLLSFSFPFLFFFCISSSFSSSSFSLFLHFVLFPLASFLSSLFCPFPLLTLSSFPSPILPPNSFPSHFPRETIPFNLP